MTSGNTPLFPDVMSALIAKLRLRNGEIGNLQMAQQLLFLAKAN